MTAAVGVMNCITRTPLPSTTALPVASPSTTRKVSGNSSVKHNDNTSAPQVSQPVGELLADQPGNAGTTAVDRPHPLRRQRGHDGTASRTSCRDAASWALISSR